MSGATAELQPVSSLPPLSGVAPWTPSTELFIRTCIAGASLATLAAAIRALPPQHRDRLLSAQGAASSPGGCGQRQAEFVAKKWG